MGITHLCENAHFTYKILQYTCFNCTGAILAHMINVYAICLNTTNYPIFNMQYFRYCLWTSILDYFGQLVSPPCCTFLYHLHTHSNNNIIYVWRGGGVQHNEHSWGKGNNYNNELKFGFQLSPPHRYWMVPYQDTCKTITKLIFDPIQF